MADAPAPAQSLPHDKPVNGEDVTDESSNDMNDDEDYVSDEDDVINAGLSRRGDHDGGRILHRISRPSLNTLDSSPPHSWWSRLVNFVFPPSDDDIDSYIPHYRHTPIFSAVLIPFAILLEIPGLTERWYIRTDSGRVVDTKPNTALLDVALGFSITCAVIANLCLITRFLEKNVKTMTVACTVFLTIHDIINIIAVTIFGVEHRFDDGYTYGDAFWMVVCSTVVSTITNITLIIDLVRTPDFEKSGSGLTRKQRSLVILVMVLFIYIGLGAMINSLLLGLSFINGLFFTVVSIETIGFGDIVPTTTASRIFTCIYSAAGIVNVGVVASLFWETVSEGLEIGYRRRVTELLAKRRAARRKRKADDKWRQAVIWRLRKRGAPVWVRTRKRDEMRGIWIKFRLWMTCLSSPHSVFASSRTNQGPPGMRLNLEALSHAQLEAAALEAGVPLDTLLPPDFHSPHHNLHEKEAEHSHSETNIPGVFLSPQQVHQHEEPVFGLLTHERVGRMAAVLTRFAMMMYDSAGNAPQEWDQDNGEENPSAWSLIGPSNNGPLPQTGILPQRTNSGESVNSDYRTEVADTERKAFYTRLTIAWLAFLIFWLVGSAIFMRTEGWSFGISVYFCFIAFTTIGYGDYVPDTPAGRAVFVVWALLGVATMTALISVISEAYSSRFKQIMQAGLFEKAVVQYRRRTTEAVAMDSTGGPTVRFYPQEQPSVKRRRDQALGPDDSHSSSSEEDKDGSHETAEGEVDTSSSKLAQANARAKEVLDALPSRVLGQAHTFQQYLHYWDKGSSGGATAEAIEFVQEQMKSLLDDVVGPESRPSAKAELLQDDATRQALFTLSIENVLKEMRSVAEEAIQALNERNSLIASQEEGGGQ